MCGDAVEQNAREKKMADLVRKLKRLHLHSGDASLSSKVTEAKLAPLVQLTRCDDLMAELNLMNYKAKQPTEITVHKTLDEDGN